MEDEVVGDKQLQRALCFGCYEVGILVRDEDVFEGHQLLLQRMIHTHGNELLERKCILDGVDTGKLVEAPLMLRDTLKVLATQLATQS